MAKPFLGVISVNIEGFSQTKSVILSDITRDYDIICIQETHRGANSIRPSIEGKKLLAEIRHRQYGSAMFCSPNLNIEEIHTDTSDDNIERITVCLSDIRVTAVYKPPNTPFSWARLPASTERQHQVIIGDFNSHNTAWGYPTTNTDGELVEDWAETEDINLIHDPKQPPSFNSGRWKRGYNPDLVFVNRQMAAMCLKTVAEPIPRTQHRPIAITFDSQIRALKIPFRRRFNLKKANWELFEEQMEGFVETYLSRPATMTASRLP